MTDLVRSTGLRPYTRVSPRVIVTTSWPDAVVFGSEEQRQQVQSAVRTFLNVETDPVDRKLALSILRKSRGARLSLEPEEKTLLRFIMHAFPAGHRPEGSEPALGQSGAFREAVRRMQTGGVPEGFGPERYYDPYILEEGRQ